VKHTFLFPLTLLALVFSVAAFVLRSHRGWGRGVSVVLAGPGVLWVVGASVMLISKENFVPEASIVIVTALFGLFAFGLSWLNNTYGPPDTETVDATKKTQ
jgi:hypothetical protein